MARMSHRYPQELRERAVRLVAESREEYESEWAAIESVATKLGIGSSETLRKWVRRAEVDAGQRPGVTSQESAEVRRLGVKSGMSLVEAGGPIMIGYAAGIGMTIGSVFGRIAGEGAARNARN